MSNAMEFKITGADALLSKLQKMADYSDVKNAVKINTSELAKGAMRNAPVDTGHLKRSIVPEITDLVGRVKATADYAPYVELGTRFMAAQPFIAPAFQTQRAKFLDDLKRIMR